jgi:hypothetical protein
MPSSVTTSLTIDLFVSQHNHGNVVKRDVLLMVNIGIRCQQDVELVLSQAEQNAVAELIPSQFFGEADRVRKEVMA